jgi:MHS family proline/betaine transporter-like MFS transporter
MVSTKKDPTGPAEAVAGTAPTNADVPPQTLRKVVTAGAIGVFVEYYDYAAYGLVAGTIAAVFFPTDDPAAALLLTYGVFALTFVFRPIGGIILGHISDRSGRKRVMVFTLTLMAVATTLIGVLPTYAAIGFVAPILLLLLRLAQGFSAGGEMGSAMSFVGEWSRPRNRARNLALVHFGSYTALLFGSVLAFGLNTGLGEAVMIEWGWRIVFLIAAPLGIIGFYIRMKLQDTPAYRQLVELGKVSKSPFKETISVGSNRLAVLGALVVPILNGAGYYVLFVYMPTYLKANLGFTVGDGLVITVVGIVVSLILIPVMGMLADRVGRRPLMIASAVLVIALALPAYNLMTAGTLISAALGAALLAVVFSPQPGIVHSVLVELFRTRVRNTGYSIGYNIATAIFGGAAPFIITWIISLTGAVSSPAIFLMIAAALTTIGLLTIKETKGIALQD